jgi:hypothetical protein
MKSVRVTVATLALAMSGCASSVEVQHAAYNHQARANELEARGDYYRAGKERAAAQKQFAKARARQYDEERWGIYHF